MITKKDFIVTAYAQAASGPGWANYPVWVIVRSKDNKLRQECIQPDEQSATLYNLYKISESVNHVMRGAVMEIQQRAKK